MHRNCDKKEYKEIDDNNPLSLIRPTITNPSIDFMFFVRKIVKTKEENVLSKQEKILDCEMT